MVEASSQFTYQTKKAGDLIESKAWNDAMAEIERLEDAKVNRNGTDTLQGPLTIQEALSVGVVTATTPTPVDGTRLKIASSETDLVNIRFSVAGGGKLEFVNWESGWTISNKTPTKHLYINRDADTSSNVYIGRLNQEILIRGDNGNVGIGTSSPSQKLEVSGNAIVTGNVGIGTSSPSQKLHVNGNAIVSDKVGIGTTYPQEKLDVRGNANGTGTVSSSNRTTVTGASTQFQTQLKVGDLITATYTSGQTSYTETRRVTGISSNTSLTVDPAFTASVPAQTSFTFQSPVLLVQNGGNVGIGTSSPSQKLEVSGNAIVSGSIGINLDTTDPNTPIPDAKLHVAGAVGTAGVETAEIIRLLRPIAMNGSNTIKRSNSAGLFLGTFEGVVDGKARLDFKLSGAPGQSNAYGRVPDVTVMTLQANGNVGIGTTSPGAKLDVNGTLAVTGTSTLAGSLTVNNTVSLNGALGKTGLSVDANGNVTMGGALVVTGTSTLTGSLTVNNTVSLNGASNKTGLSVDANGNVGIGTTSPTAKLDVAGVADTNGQISLQLRSGNGANNFNSNQITFGWSNTDTYRHAIKTRHKAGNRSGNAIDFYVWKGDVTADTPAAIGSLHTMTLDGGNVGIGTTSPAAKLDVNGTLAVTGTSTLAGSLTVNNTVSLNGASGKTGLSVDANGNVAMGGTLAVTGNSTLTGSLTVNNTVSLNGASNTTGLSVDSNGNVGIGTTSPKSSLEIRKDVAAKIGATLTLSNYKGGGGGGAIDFNGYDVGTNDPTARISSSDLNWSSHLAFFTKKPGDPGNSLEERLRIQHDGNVGIGTTSPSQKLHVNGDAIVTGNVQAGSLSVTGTGNATIGGTLSAESLKATGTGDSTFAGAVKVTGAVSAASLSTTGTGTLAVSGTSTLSGSLTVNNIVSLKGALGKTGLSIDSNGNVAMGGTLAVTGTSTLAGSLTVNNTVSLNGASNKTGLSVDANGNVGIGTSSPQSKLTINNPITNFNSFSPVNYGDAPLTIFEPTPNGGNTPNGTRDILNLVREGVHNESYANKVSLAIGRYENQSDLSRTQLDIKLTDDTFNKHNTVMSLQAGGNVGIGTTSPRDKLDVWGNAISGTGTISGSVIDRKNVLGAGTQFTAQLKQGDLINATYTSTSTKISYTETRQVMGITNDTSLTVDPAFTEVIPKGTNFTFRSSVVLVQGNGNVGIGTTTPSQKLEVAGTVKATNFSPPSSRELKTNIADLSQAEAMQVLAELNPVKFHYKDDLLQLRLGFIAEEMPELLTTDRKSFSIPDLIAVLTKVVQAQQIFMTQLAEKVN